MLSSCKKEEIPLTISFDVPEGGGFVIEQGQSLDLPFTVAGDIEGAIKVSATSDNAEYKVDAAMSSGSSGTVTVTAPELVYSTSTVKITLNAEDAVSLKTATASADVSVVMFEGYAEISTPSNCYIVKPGAFVKFPANIGNTSDKADVASAELLWQDVNGLVKQVIPDSENGCIYAVLGEGSQGNAVVAAKKSDGTVSWSWHLWVTEFDPEANVMVWTDGNSVTYNIMDRYLGALSNVPGSDLSNGLFYQWGRKDPFISSDYSGALKPMYDIAGNTIEKTIEACGSEDNIPASIANPMTHFSGVSGGNYSWLTTVKANIVTDESMDLWSGKTGKKSEYDPCPDGWRVIPMDAWGFYADPEVKVEIVYAEGVETPANKDQLGRKVTVGNSEFFFPSQGEVQHSGSYGSGIGTTWPCGKAWSSTIDADYYRVFVPMVSPSSIGLTSGVVLGYELPVRCVKM